jgi:hypothetical protein
MRKGEKYSELPTSENVDEKMHASPMQTSVVNPSEEPEEDDRGSEIGGTLKARSTVKLYR